MEEKIQTTKEQIMNFGYKKGTVSLNFSLNLSNLKEIEDFKELLTAAVIELAQIKQ